MIAKLESVRKQRVATAVPHNQAFVGDLKSRPSELSPHFSLDSILGVKQAGELQFITDIRGKRLSPSYRDLRLFLVKGAEQQALAFVAKDTKGFFIFGSIDLNSLKIKASKAHSYHQVELDPQSGHLFATIGASGRLVSPFDGAPLHDDMFHDVRRILTEQGNIIFKGKTGDRTNALRPIGDFEILGARVYQLPLPLARSSAFENLSISRPTYPAEDTLDDLNRAFKDKVWMDLGETMRGVATQVAAMRSNELSLKDELHSAEVNVSKLKAAIGLLDRLSFGFSKTSRALKAAKLNLTRAQDSLDAHEQLFSELWKKPKALVESYAKENEDFGELEVLFANLERFFDRFEPLLYGLELQEQLLNEQGEALSQRELRSSLLVLPEAGSLALALDSDCQRHLDLSRFRIQLLRPITAIPLAIKLSRLATIAEDLLRKDDDLDQKLVLRLTKDLVQVIGEIKESWKEVHKKCEDSVTSRSKALQELYLLGINRLEPGS